MALFALFGIAPGVFIALLSGGLNKGAAVRGVLAGGS